MGYEDEMEEYYDEIYGEKCYYQLIVPTGTYSSDNFFSLMWQVLKHRLQHLFKHGRWVD